MATNTTAAIGKFAARLDDAMCSARAIARLSAEHQIGIEWYAILERERFEQQRQRCRLITLNQVLNPGA